MTQFIKQPGAITIAPDFSGIAVDRVPAGYYRIGVSQSLGWHLVPIEPLQLADKVYGSLLQHVPRIEQVWDERKGVPTTVLLEGLKGSGKSLLMKSLAKRFVEQQDGIVLLCNSSFTGDGFFEFLQQISQKKIVLMDEFDKVYNQEDDRNNILTLLDGTMASHTLFILTMNASSASSKYEFFHNRPGRVFFNIKFTGVDYEAIQAYLEDCLDDKSRIAEVMTFVKRFTQFNMDMLGTLVREINAVPDKALDKIAEYLNTKPDLSMDDIYFNYAIIRNGVDITKIATGVSSGNFKDLIRGIQNPQRETYTNIMGSRNVYWNATENREWDPVKDSTETAARQNGAYIRGVNKKEQTFLPYFDEYVKAANCTMTQDPATGVITIHGFDDDINDRDEDTNEYTFVLTPEVMKRYSMSF